MPIGWWEEWPWTTSTPASSTSRRANRRRPGSTVYPQFGPQWIETIVAATERWGSSAAATRSTDVLERSASSATPGRRSPAAQATGTPLDDEQTPSTATRPEGVSTTAGVHASARSRPAPVVRMP